MLEKFRYEDLTWPEVNEAVEVGRIPILPVGAIEQHGPHLPLKIDRWESTSIAEEAARRSPARLLVMPPVAYGYASHVMDFPGTITIHHETFIRYVVDIVKSLAFHGFKRIMILNGHGSNQNPLELAGRRAMLETDAWVGMASWWNMTQADPGFMDKWRESAFPGGCAHAGEAETSVALHLDKDSVRMDLAENCEIDMNLQKSKFHWIDLFASGPVKMDSWTSTYADIGTMGEAADATAEKGEMLFEEAVSNVIEFAEEFAARKFLPRTDHHSTPPTIPPPG